MTDDQLNKARELVEKIGLRPAARELGMSHTTLYRRLHKPPKVDQTPMQQLVDAIERYARWIFDRPPMPKENPNWVRNCEWIEQRINEHLDSWTLRND